MNTHHFHIHNKTINVKPFGFQEYRLIHEVIVGLTKEGAKGELV